MAIWPVSALPRLVVAPAQHRRQGCCLPTPGGSAHAAASSPPGGRWHHEPLRPWSFPGPPGAAARQLSPALPGSPTCRLALGDRAPAFDSPAPHPALLRGRQHAALAAPSLRVPAAPPRPAPRPCRAPPTARLAPFSSPYYHRNHAPFRRSQCAALTGGRCLPLFPPPPLFFPTVTAPFRRSQWVALTGGCCFSSPLPLCLVTLDLAAAGAPWRLPPLLPGSVSRVCCRLLARLARVLPLQYGAAAGPFRDALHRGA